MMNSLRADGVPTPIPWLMTEYGYSVFAGRREVDIEGALFTADTVGAFLTLGGSKPYLYGYEPNYLEDELNCSWGNLMMLQLNPDNEQLNRLSGYHAGQLITKEWMQPTNDTHEVFRVSLTQRKDGAHPFDLRSGQAVTRPTQSTSSSPVTVYAVRRPDKQWSLLAINKDPKRTARLNILFDLPGTQRQQSFTGDVDVIQFSRDQYMWHDDGPNGHPIRSLPPARLMRKDTPFYDLPPYSLTVLRGKLPD